MPKNRFALPITVLICAVLLSANTRYSPPAPPVQNPVQSGPLQSETGVQPATQAFADQPIFKYPVVPNAVISGYFDHQPASGLLTFYNGRHSSSGAGFYFSCSNPSMYDWVGCEDAVSGEVACNNNRELWYDGHHGIDFEYSANWYTGATCDPGRFSGITRQVYAPARGQVLMAGTDPNRPANGWHIRLKHDLNGNGNFDDDNFRSVYLHFTANALAVVPGQIVSEGQYLGLGGSTGYSSSPHLHFEVQRSSDYFQTNYWSVDPYGWQGGGSDPWPYQNVNLWRPTVTFTQFIHLPYVSKDSAGCSACADLIQNGGFEAGHTLWDEQGVMLIVQKGEPNLTVTPYSGDWLAWLGGRNDALDVINQDFVVPGGASGGVLRFALLVSTSEPGGPQDYLYVRLRKTDGTVLQEQLIDNTFAPQGQWLQREITLIDLSPYRGQTLRLNIKATTNSAYLTSFYLDNISLWSNGP